MAPLAIFDLDGTLTPVVSSWRYIHERLGIWTDRAEEHQRRYLAGEIDYVTFCALDAREWAGIPIAEVQRIAAEIPYAPGARETVMALRRMGFRLAIISSGLDILARRVADELNFDRWLANSLLARDGVLIGEAIVRVDDARKWVAAEELLSQFGVGWDQALAVGDSPGDIPLLRRAALGIACEPVSPEVAASAHHVVRRQDFPRIAELARSTWLSGAHAP